MKFGNFKQNWVVFRSLLALVFVALIIGTFFVSWATWSFGSVQTGWAYIGGYRVIPVSESIEFDSVPAGTKVQGTFVLQNLSNQDIHYRSKTGLPLYYGFALSNTSQKTRTLDLFGNFNLGILGKLVLFNSM